MVHNRVQTQRQQQSLVCWCWLSCVSEKRETNRRTKRVEAAKTRVIVNREHREAAWWGMPVPCLNWERMRASVCSKYLMWISVRDYQRCFPSRRNIFSLMMLEVVGKFVDLESNGWVRTPKIEFFALNLAKLSHQPIQNILNKTPPTFRQQTFFSHMLKRLKTEKFTRENNFYLVGLRVCLSIQGRH